MSVTTTMDKKASPPSAIAGKLDAWCARMLSSRLGRVSAAIWSRAPNDATAFCASFCSMRRWSGVTALLIRFVVVGFTQSFFKPREANYYYHEAWSHLKKKKIISVWLFLVDFCILSVQDLYFVATRAANSVMKRGQDQALPVSFCDDATHSDKS